MAEVIVGDDGREVEAASVGGALAAAALSGEAAAEGRQAQVQAQEASAKADAALAQSGSAAQMAASAGQQASQAEASVDDKIAAGFATLAAQLAAALKPQEPAGGAPAPAPVERGAPPTDAQPKSVRKKSTLRDWYASH